MGSFGERLQREREMRGITLDEIAEATKIGTRSLRALEEQDFDKLPGGIFNKGFVRAYSRYLGLDEEQAVADYLTALGEAQAAGKLTRQESTVNLTTPERALLMSKIEDSEPTRLPLGLIAVVVVVAVVLFSGWKYYARNGLPNLRRVRATAQQAAVQPAPKMAAAAVTTVEPPPAVANALQPSGPATTLVQPQPASRPEAMGPQADPGFVVRIKAKQDTWISIVADGKPTMSGVLPLASEKTVRAQHSVVLKTGNAGGLELFHNDKLVSPLGGIGEVKNVEFTAAGLKNKADAPESKSPDALTKQQKSPKP